MHRPAIPFQKEGMSKMAIPTHVRTVAQLRSRRAHHVLLSNILGSHLGLQQRRTMSTVMLLLLIYKSFV